MPTEKVIRDRIGNRVDFMVDGGNEIVVRNIVGTRLGHFDNSPGTSRDKWGNKITEGNIVASLIMDDRKR